MSRDMINAVVIGRLTKDPELKMTASGAVVCPFTVAVNRYRNEKTETVYIECISFSKIAEGISKNFKRGSNIAVVIDWWQEKNWLAADGTKRCKIECEVKNFAYTGAKDLGVTTTQPSEQNAVGENYAGPAPSFEDETDDLPF